MSLTLSMALVPKMRYSSRYLTLHTCFPDAEVAEHPSVSDRAGSGGADLQRALQGDRRHLLGGPGRQTLPRPAVSARRASPRDPSWLSGGLPYQDGFPSSRGHGQP